MHLLTNLTEPSPSKVNSSPKTRMQRRRTMALTYHLFKIHFNIIFPSMAKFSQWCLSFLAVPSKPCMHSSSLQCVLHVCQSYLEEVVH
jgi:hypothetical protein